MKQVVIIVGAVYGAPSVILGAFASHALRKVLNPQALDSFETGVKYQMYHAIVLLVIGFYFSFNNKLENFMGWAFIVGTFLFSVSIYFLSLSSAWKVNLSFLGPITPLGGLLMIIAWTLLIIRAIKMI